MPAFRLRRVHWLLAASAFVSGPAASGAQPHTETAVLAGGCFWGMEAVFEHVQGVEDVESGYAGGSQQSASYEAVSGERTGHAEAVRIRFDPRRLSYSSLLNIYFTIAHDPTQLNRQGPDTGPSYRSAIFPQSQRQKQLAAEAIARLRAARKPVVTRLESGAFFPAETYHQDFVRRYPWHPYVIANDRPKLRRLKLEYPQLWRS